MILSKEFIETLKKTKMNYTPKRFLRILIIFSSIVSGLISGLFIAILLFNGKPITIGLISFVIVFFFTFEIIKLIPIMNVKSKKATLESDLLYSARHLLLKLESGSSLINSLESVSELKTKSNIYFKEMVFDISLGVPIEEALEKSIEYSPSKAYTKILQEIKTSLKTGADLQKSLKSTLKDVTRQHLLFIQEYGKKLNPMSMFYMILGTILPSIGTAMLIVGASLLPGVLIIDLRILLFITFILFSVQLFFLFAFRSLKPAVME